MKETNLFTDFFKSEKSSGIILILCTAISLLLANSSVAESYSRLWHSNIFSRPIEFWINDGLMTIFFLMVGLEIEREIYNGELSSLKKSMLPVVAAIGGMIVPAAIHFFFNYGTTSQHGFGIPMATDIAFSLGILSLLGKRVPLSLKIFLTALAIIDDLGAIVVIAFFYSSDFSPAYFGFALLIFLIMLVLNRTKVYQTWIYLLLGCVMWFCMYRSGIHPTITGVLLAFAMPFGKGDEKSTSYKLQHRLHKPVAFIILPLFALANTAIHIQSSVTTDLAGSNSIGIMAGLLIGKPIGIFLFAILGVATGLCSIPPEIKKTTLFGTGILAGIGFTMSIFISLLSFDNMSSIDSSKIAVLIASAFAGLTGYVWLRFSLRVKTSV